MEQNGDRPATKKDLAELKGEVSELREAVVDMETRLLRAFYSWAQTQDRRVEDLGASDATLRARMNIVENRITDVERRLNMPPEPPKAN